MRVKTMHYENADVDVIYSDISLDTPATYIGKFNVAIVDGTLSETEINKAMLHEIGHAANHQNESSLYCSTASSHLKMEHEADKFMVNELVHEYLLQSGIDAKDVNYQDFANNNHLKDSSLVKKTLRSNI